MREILGYIGKILEYLFAIFFVGIFTLYCSGRVGWFLILVLLLAPVLSMVYARIITRYIDVTGTIDGEIFSKGDHLALKITIRNRGIIPSPFLRVELLENENWKTEHTIFVTARKPKAEDTIIVNYQAQYAGGSQIGVKAVYVCDYLGIVSIPLKIEADTLRWVVGIIPDIEQASSEEEFMLEVQRQISGQSESEETIDASSDSFGGFPGYEYRGYRPGDPIKRINYKLSAKKDSLWVRLDEKQAISTIYLMLDPYDTAEAGGALVKQHVLETGLGFVRSFLLHEFVVEVWIKSLENDTLERHVILEEEQLIMLSRAFAKYQFMEKRMPLKIPKPVDEEGSHLIYVTPNRDRELLMEAEHLEKEKAVRIHIYDTEERGNLMC